ncbi:MAG TPA: Mur ligase family protein [Trueperaceae bacterium]
MTDTAHAEALAWLYGQTRDGGERHPRRARWLLRALGLSAPPNVVRVVGTNGKGTVSDLIAAGLRAAGYDTGLFLSPHVERFEERVAMNGVPVGPEAVVEFVARARELLRRRPPTPAERPAFFELTLALALSEFARGGADWAVLEAGIGGATDATAAVLEGVRLVVLTNVDLDHLNTIGPTLQDVAREKAGAFAPGVPAVTAATGPGLEVARAVARERGTDLIEVAPLTPGEPTRAANERVAAAALKVLSVPQSAIDVALARPPLPGRGERFALGHAEVLLDGAHDPAAAAHLRSRVGAGYVLLFGALGRKQGAATLAALEPGAAHVVITEAAAGEGTTHLEGPGRETVADPELALRRALALVPPGGQVVVAGSLYLAGRLRPLIDSLAHAADTIVHRG